MEIAGATFVAAGGGGRRTRRVCAGQRVERGPGGAAGDRNPGARRPAGREVPGCRRGDVLAARAADGAERRRQPVGTALPAVRVHPALDPHRRRAGGHGSASPRRGDSWRRSWWSPPASSSSGARTRTCRVPSRTYGRLLELRGAGNVAGRLHRHRSAGGSSRSRPHCTRRGPCCSWTAGPRPGGRWPCSPASRTSRRCAASASPRPVRSTAGSTERRSSSGGSRHRRSGRWCFPASFQSGRDGLPTARSVDDKIRIRTPPLLGTTDSSSSGRGARNSTRPLSNATGRRVGRGGGCPSTRRRP